MSDDHLYDLVIQWDQQRQLGEEVTPELLCKDQPELLPELQARIASVKASDWMFQPDDEDDDFLSLPDFATVVQHADETQLPPITVSIDEFAKAIADSGLMTGEEVAAIQQRSAAKNAQELAHLLLREKKLTTYQAKRICDGNTKRLVLGNYIILDEIGAGGMGQVFKARHRRMKRIVALKVLPEHAVNSPTALERFHREVEAAAKLEHPNIVTAYDADESDGTHFLVMQYVDGQDLATLVQRRGRLSVSKAVDCILQAAKGLEFAHGEGVIHRDIKPANLLIDKNGCVKVLDMGLALLETSNGNGSYAATQAHLTQDGTVMGTVDYMSPEQALDTHHADVRSDIYSLGCTLFYLLTGQPLHEGKTLMAKMLAHRETVNPVLHEVRAGVPEALSTIYETMVAKKPEDRYPSMKSLLTELETVAAEIEEEEEVDSPSEPSPDSAVEMSSRETSSASLGDTIVLQPKPEPATKDSPQLVAQTASGRRNMFIGGVATVAVAIFAWLYFAGIIFKVETKEGMIVIETNVPDVEVLVDGQKVVTITDPKDKGKVKVEVKPGAKMLTVSKEGFEAEVSNFTLKTVKGPIKVTFVPKSSPTNDVEREVAEWVLRNGGEVTINRRSKEGRLGVSSLTDLPETAFDLTDIYPTPVDRVSDHVLQLLPRLKQLHGINIPNIKNGDAVLAQLSGIPQLRAVNVQAAQVTDVGLRNFAAKADTLEVLHIGNTGVSNAGLKHLQSLLELRELFLGGTAVDDSGLPALTGLSRLQRLELIGTKVTASGVAELQKALPNCKIIFGDIHREVAEWVLSVGGDVRITIGDESTTTVVETPKELPDAHFRLVGVDFKGANISDGDLQHLDGLSNLDVVLSKSPITGTGLKHLIGIDINWLTLSETKVSDETLADVLPRLKFRSLELEKTTIGDATLALLKDQDYFWTLRLNETRITDDGLRHLNGIEVQGLLILSSTSITGSGFAALDDLGGIHSLDVSSTPFSDDGLKHISRAENLTTLHVAATKVTDVGLSHLTRAQKLTKLHVGQTEVTDDGLGFIGRIKSLTHVTLTDTKVTESGVIALSKALPNCRIEWDGGVIDPTGDIHQQVAERVLKVGGWLVVTHGDDQSKEVRKTEDLPEATFRVTGVDLTGNIELDEDGLKLLNQLDYLDYLAFDHNPHFSDSTLAQIPSLTVRDLRLSNVAVTDQGIQSLNLRELWAIRISNTAIGDKGFQYLSTGPNFAQLDADNTAVSDKGVAALVNDPLHPMTHLSLNDCSITDDALQHLKDWTDLSGLHLANTQITDAGLILLTKVGGGIDVTGTEVTRAGVLALQKAHPSVTISTDWNTDPNRRAADWALACGGTVIAQFQFDTGFAYSRTLQNPDDITDDKFRITGIAVNHPELNHGGQHNLDGLTGLRRLDMSGSNFDPHYLLTNAIQTITALSANDLQGDLDLNYSIKTLVDYTFERTGEYPNLTLLELRNTSIGNVGAESLKKLTSLRYLDVTDTKISPTVIKSLQEALPNCLVVSQFNPASKDPNRRATHWLLGVGATVDIRTGWDGNSEPRGNDWRRFSNELIHSPAGLTQAGTGQVFEEPFSLTGAHFWGPNSTRQVPIFDADWQYLSGTKLWNIGLSKSPVTNMALEQIARLPIREITVSNTAITDEGVRHLSEAEYLQYLGLYACGNITDAGVAHLAKTKLDYLDLRATAVTDAALEHVARIKRLETLSLHGPNISDAWIEHLSSLTNLKELNLSVTKLTAKGIETLKKALPNCKIIWDGDKDNEEDK